MKEPIVYLDNAATTKVCEEAARAALSAMTDTFGNPSSTHTLGREAAAVLENARAAVASAMGAKPTELFFTSGGTEGDNWAIRGAAGTAFRRGKHIISSEVEHDAVRRSLDALEKEGFSVTRLKPNARGGIDVEAVEAALREDTILVSLMMVNNETGAVTDIAAVSRLLKKQHSQALLHTDAVQGFMKVPFSAKTLGADLITVSGHKIHAPKGVGALYIRSGVRLSQILYGGSQESKIRPGTEALPAIAAFGAAAELAAKGMKDNLAHMSALRELAIRELRAAMPDVVILGGGAPHILSLSVPGGRSEVFMNCLEAENIFVSKSSACKKGGRSHVLEAMGLDAAVIDAALRVGLSRYTTEEEVLTFVRHLAQARQTLFPKK